MPVPKGFLLFFSLFLNFSLAGRDRSRSAARSGVSGVSVREGRGKRTGWQEGREKRNGNGRLDFLDQNERNVGIIELGSRHTHSSWVVRSRTLTHRYLENITYLFNLLLSFTMTVHLIRLGSILWKGNRFKFSSDVSGLSFYFICALGIISYYSARANLRAFHSKRAKKGKTAMTRILHENRGSLLFVCSYIAPKRTFAPLVSSGREFHPFILFS